MDKPLNILLNDLCVEWGFCLDPEFLKSLKNAQMLDADEFACAVLKAEGMDCELEVEWRRKIRNKYIERFGNELNANDIDNAF